MLIQEIFDNPFNLITGTEQTDKIKKLVYDKAPTVKNVSVFEVADDPKNVFIRFAYKGAWEIHHSYNLTSGSINPMATAPNPRFVGTMIKMYEQCLDRGSKIRIVAAIPAINSLGNRGKDMMDNYEKIAKIIVSKRTGLEVSPVIENFVCADGEIGNAIEISPVGKFPKMLNSIKKSVNFKEDY
jgi:hypothetical protein